MVLRECCGNFRSREIACRFGATPVQADGHDAPAIRNWGSVLEMGGPAGSELMAGRVALVTGAAKGLGRAIVDHLALAGASGTALDILPADETGEFPEGWEFRQGDVCIEQDVGAAIAETAERLGRLDAVVANAGITAPWVATGDIDLGDWRRVFRVNVEGTLVTIKAASRQMMETGGSIVAIGSLNSWQGHPRQAAYVASKHAVLGLVRSAALDLGRHGIRVNALAPGPVATGALLGRIRDRADRGGQAFDEVMQDMARATSLGRTASKAEVAAACLFLLSDLSNGITGQLLPVDAGLP